MLSPSQEEAVNHKMGTAIVLAGAGSGKTRVLTNRIAKLIWDGIPPSNIFATTFTNKAAAEIRERTSILTAGLSESVWLGTFHSLAIKILREYLEGEIHFNTSNSMLPELTWEKSFTIYDENDSRSIFYDLGKRMGLDREDILNVRSIISKMRNEGFGIIDNPDNFKYPSGCVKLFWESLAEFAQNNSLGYDEILWVCVALLKEEPVLQALLQSKFQHILVDECQDLNQIQHILMHLLFFGEDLPQNHDYSGISLYGKKQPRSLFLVGDIDQAIYSWRGAKPNLIVEFPEKYGAKIYRVEENYRSIPSILETANRLISNNESRIEKKLIPTRDDVEKQVSWFWAWDDEQEAINIAKTIKKLTDTNGEIESDTELKNIAILYRTKQQSKAIEQSLAKFGITYRILDGTKFFDRKEVKDILYYLRLSINPDDAIAIERTINTPRRGIGGTTLGKLKNLAELRKVSLWTILKEPFNYQGIAKGKALVALKDYLALILELQGVALSPSIVSSLCQRTGYDRYLDSIDDQEERCSRMENLGELQNAIDGYLLANPEGTIGKFLESITLDSSQDRKEDRHRDAVSLLTIHSAKGLEFPIVFLSGLEQNTLPHFRSTTLEELEEERRLCYVAVTRAKDRLFMSGASYRNGRNYQPSEFVEEMKKK